MKKGRTRSFRPAGATAVRVLLLAVLLFLTVPSSVFAEPAEESAPDGETGYEAALYAEQKQITGAERLFEELPESAQTLLHRLGLDTLEPESLMNLRLGDMLSVLWDATLSRLHTPLLVLGQVLAAVLLGALLGVFTQDGDGTQARVFALVQTLFLCALLLPKLIVCADAAVEVVRVSNHFMLAYIPVYTACAALGGRTLTASACHLSFFGAVEGLGALLPAVLTPLLYALLAFGVAASVGDETLRRAAGLLQKTAVWLLGVVSTVVSALLSIQTLLAQGTENVLSRTAKYVLSAAVPVVGGVLSDALLAVKGSAGVLKAEVGAVGLGAALAVFLPPLLELLCWSVCLRLGELAAGLFGQDAAAALLESGRAAIRLLTALLLCMLLLALLSTLILMAAGRSST